MAPDSSQAPTRKMPGGRLKTVFLSATATGKGKRPARTLLHGKNALTLWGRGGELLYPNPWGAGEDPTWLKKRSKKKAVLEGAEGPIPGLCQRPPQTLGEGRNSFLRRTRHPGRVGFIQGQQNQ